MKETKCETIDSLRFRITKRFGTKTVLKDFSLEVRGKQFITLLGPSGCGKSTALNIVAGLIPATEGEVWIDGERIDHMPPEKRGFGMVFQNYALFPHMTVFANIAFGLQLQRRPAAEIAERVHNMLDLVQLVGYEGRYPGQLSGGQQQRIAIARALVLCPRLMLLDEPLSNLDAKLRIEMRAEIKRLHSSLDLTSIYVTHDQTEALSLSDLIVVMKDGILVQAGSPQKIHDYPVSVFVADFMGFRNFIPTQVTAFGPDGDVQAESQGMKIHGKTQHAFVPGAQVVAGIRPDDIVVGGDSSGPNAFRAKADIVEYLGREDEVIVTLEAGGRLWVRTAARLTPGENLTVVLPPERILFFPPEGSGGTV